MLRLLENISEMLEFGPSLEECDMEFLLPVLFLSLLSVGFAVVLAIANKKLKVWEDPRIDGVSDLLPGANCGACGVPGCRAFAEKVVALEVAPAKCSVGGPQGATKVAQYLGIDAGQEEKKVARLLCAGGCEEAIQAADYAGYPSCRAAALVAGGGKGCSYGCLGLSDCEEVCKFKAIVMKDGLPLVDIEKCTACGDCVAVCPKGLFEIMPLKRRLIVQCKCLLGDAEAVTALCKVGCTGCGKCAADAPQGLIQMQNNLPVIDTALLHLETRKVIFRCPTGAIAWVEGRQFPKVETPDLLVCK